MDPVALILILAIGAVAGSLAGQIVILGATDSRAPAGFAPIAIGLGLTLIHLISIPTTNTSVNPARSTSQALFAGGDSLVQLWLFWLAPIASAAIGALVYKAELSEDDA